MGEKVEWFSGALCFTPFLGILDLLCIFHFAISWYRSVRKTGWKIDFWYLTLLMWSVPSILILYPFNGSIYNDLCTLGSYHQILPLIDQAFKISISGYICLWIGRYLFDRTSIRNLLILLFGEARSLFQMVEKNIKSRVSCFFVFIMALFFGSFVLFVQINEGYLFNARGCFLQIDYLRPVFNFTISLFSISLFMLALRYIQFKEKIWFWLFGILLLFSPFFGVRSIALGSIVFFLSHRIFLNRGKVSYGKSIAVCSILWILIIILGDLRDGNFNLLDSISITAFRFFYGNNFSDTRDFAWILSAWDGDYLYGKTYLAALLSFIPRYLCPFREDWAVSMYTNSLLGFDSNVMPGLRPGLFGESFLNFGYFGVVFLGLLLGVAIRYVDVKIKEHVLRDSDLIKGYSYSMIFSLVSNLSISAGAWFFYVLILFHLLAALLRRIRFRTEKNPSLYHS